MLSIFVLKQFVTHTKYFQFALRELLPEAKGQICFFYLFILQPVSWSFSVSMPWVRGVDFLVSYVDISWKSVWHWNLSISLPHRPLIAGRHTWLWVKWVGLKLCSQKWKKTPKFLILEPMFQCFFGFLVTVIPLQVCFQKLNRRCLSWWKQNRKARKLFRSVYRLGNLNIFLAKKYLFEYN